MDSLIEKNLLKSFQDGWQPPYSGSVHAWANENVSLPNNYAITGKFDVSISRYLIQPFDDLLNPKIRQVNLCAAIQTFKSGVSEVFLPYIISNDPGPVLKLHQTDEMAQTFTETRLIPLLENCKPVKDILSVDRHSAKKRSINLPHMAVKISGPKESVLAGMSIKYLMLDEAWLYPKEVIQKAKGRTSAFSHNCKIIISSQPGIEGDDWSKEFHSGIIYEWSWLCPQCKNFQPYYWSEKKPGWTKENPQWAGIVWDKHLTPDRKHYDLEATGNSARLVCFHCPCELKDTKENRTYLNATGKYLCTKATGNPEIHSYTWNAFANPRITFKSKIIQYLQAKDHQKRTGNTDLLTVFRQQVLGKEREKFESINITKIITEVYDPQGTWAEEAYRFMTVDYQQHLGEKWYVIRAWSKTGESRLIKFGHVHSWDDIQKIANENKVRTPYVMVDSGFNTTEVYAECVKRGQEMVIGGRKYWVGWTALNGDGGTDYKNPDGIRRYYQESKRDPQLHSNPAYRGKYARLITWSNLSIKNILFHLRAGKGVKWISATNDPEYEKQLNSERLEDVENLKTGLMEKRYEKKHNDNHLLDCEAQQVLAAYMVGILGDYSAPANQFPQIAVTE